MTKMMLPAMLALVLSQGVIAQDDDGSEVVLPVEAQTCNLPAAPTRIPEAPTRDDLIAAQGKIKDFQGELAVYRECLDSASALEELTDGNRVALNQAFNYSVEMEERVAEAFNVAVRAYKESQGSEGSEGS